MIVADFLSFLAAAWLFWQSLRHIGRMSPRTSWLAYAQCLAVGTAAAATLLAYVQVVIPSSEPAPWMNIEDMRAMLLATVVVASIVDPRRDHHRRPWPEHRRIAARAREREPG